MRASFSATLSLSAALSPAVAAAAGNSAPVEKLTAASGEMYDIYPPVPLADPINWPLITAGCVVLLILAALLFWLFKKRKKEPLVTSNPRAEALAALDGARKLIDEERPLAYAGEASEILRRFIEMQFAVTSTRQTTTEFLATIGTGSENSRRLLPFRENLKACLASCDLAKYARKPADREQLEEIDRSMRTFITAAGEES